MEFNTYDDDILEKAICCNSLRRRLVLVAGGYSCVVALRLPVEPGLGSEGSVHIHLAGVD